MLNIQEIDSLADRAGVDLGILLPIGQITHESRNPDCRHVHPTIPPLMMGLPTTFDGQPLVVIRIDLMRRLYSPVTWAGASFAPRLPGIWHWRAPPAAERSVPLQPR